MSLKDIYRKFYGQFSAREEGPDDDSKPRNLKKKPQFLSDEEDETEDVEGALSITESRVDAGTFASPLTFINRSAESLRGTTVIHRDFKILPTDDFGHPIENPSDMGTARCCGKRVNRRDLVRCCVCGNETCPACRRYIGQVFRCKRCDPVDRLMSWLSGGGKNG